MPKAHSTLFVRFKDGTGNLVQLRQEQLTGAREPLRDEAFFNQVFISDGTVVWPGEIELAPDARCAKVSRKNKPTELPSRKLN